MFSPSFPGFQLFDIFLGVATAGQQISAAGLCKASFLGDSVHMCENQLRPKSLNVDMSSIKLQQQQLFFRKSDCWLIQIFHLPTLSRNSWDIQPKNALLLLPIPKDTQYQQLFLTSVTSLILGNTNFQLANTFGYSQDIQLQECFSYH